MRRIAAIAAAGVLTFAAMSAIGQESAPADALREAPAPPATPPAESAAPAKAPTAGLMAEAAAARVVAAERLRALKRPPEKGQERDKAAAAKVASLIEVFKAREVLLTEWDKTIKSRAAIEHPEPTPEAEAAELKTSLERARASLARAAKDPAILLPELFRAPIPQTTDASLAEMKEAIDKAEDDVENVKKELDTLAASTGKKAATPLAAAKADRDEIRKRIAALAPRGAEQEAALASANSSDERELARERIVNLMWEGRVESERLKEAEARIDLETRRAAVNETRAAGEKVKLELAKTTLALLQAEFRKRNDWRQADLKRASAIEGDRAEHSTDPLVRYKSRRNKENLDQDALCKDLERELNSPQSITTKGETEKADKAEADFKRLKELVQSGRSSALVAQRLNNSFRRLASERASIVRNEMAQVTVLQGRYENELTAVELDQLNDIRGDQALKENLLAAVPEARRAEAVKAFAELEQQNRNVLEKRRRLLVELEKRAEDTRQQVLRRLRILDEQHAFVRTHLFWVRDAQPMGTASMEQFRREARDLGRTVFGIAAEPWSRSHWERVSPEFGLATMGLLLLPYGLYRIRKGLRRLLERERLGRAITGS